MASPAWDSPCLQNVLSLGCVLRYSSFVWRDENFSWARLSHLSCILGVEEENRVDIVRKTLQSLPEENYEVLHLLTAFLVQVSCSEIWKLSSSSIAYALHQLFACLLPPSF